MSNIACTSCGMENAYFEVLDEKGAHYSCPDCDHEWIDKTVTAEDDEYETEEEDEDEDDEDEEEDDDENPDNVFNQAKSYAFQSVGDFLKKVIKNFDDYAITEVDLTVITKIYMLIKNNKELEVTGYIHLIVKDEQDILNMKYMELQLDIDGLQLTSGGYVTGEFGGDSYSSIIFPPNDEYEALNCVSEIDNFLTDFNQRMLSTHTTIEAFDSGDPIAGLD